LQIDGVQNEKFNFDASACRRGCCRCLFLLFFWKSLFFIVKCCSVVHILCVWAWGSMNEMNHWHWHDRWFSFNMQGKNPFGLCLLNPLCNPSPFEFSWISSVVVINEIYGTDSHVLHIHLNTP
jgi:hypothetical protein